MSLGLPSFSMIFSGKAVSAIERSARGIVAMILTDGTEGGKDLNIYKKVDEVDFQNWTEQNYKANTGTKVFITSNVKFVNAMEDLKMNVNM